MIAPSESPLLVLRSASRPPSLASALQRTPRGGAPGTAETQQRVSARIGTDRGIYDASSADRPARELGDRTSGFARRLLHPERARVDAQLASDPDEDHDHVSAVAAANHSPGSAHVHDEFGDLGACPAVGARADVVVISVPKCSNSVPAIAFPSSASMVRFSSFQVPVGPNRSVLIRPGSCPASTSASATASTNAVGPHM